jgi:hypothetical protein
MNLRGTNGQFCSGFEVLLGSWTSHGDDYCASRDRSARCLPRSRGIAQQPRKTGIAPASRAPVLGTVGVSLLMTRHYQFHSGFGRTVSGLAWGVAPTAPPGRSGPRRLRPSLPDMGKSRRACCGSGRGDKCYWQAFYLLIWDKQALSGRH